MTGETEEFREARKATQFGGERANPQRQSVTGAPAPWSIRNRLKYLLSQEINPDDKNAVRKLLGNKATAGDLIVARMITAAIEGDIRAANYIIEHTDGKPTQAVNLGGQPANPIRTESTVALTPQEAYMRMLDG